MNKYLEKIAEQSKKYKSEGGSAVKWGAGSIFTGQAAGLGAIGGMAIKAEKGPKHYSKEELSSVRSFLRKSGLGSKVKFEKDNPMGMPNPHMRENKTYKMNFRGQEVEHPFKNYGKHKTHVVNNPFKNYNVLMHELGHAKDFKNFGRTSTKARMMGYGISSKLAIPGGAALGYAAMQNKKTEKYAPLAALAPAIPALKGELTADFHALKHIGKTRGARAVGSYIGEHILPKASYGLALGAPAVATYAALRARRHNEALAKAKKK